MNQLKISIEQNQNIVATCEQQPITAPTLHPYIYIYIHKNSFQSDFTFVILLDY